MNNDDKTQQPFQITTDEDKRYAFKKLLSGTEPLTTSALAYGEEPANCPGKLDGSNELEQLRAEIAELKASLPKWVEASNEDKYGFECSLCMQIVESDEDAYPLHAHTLKDCENQVYRTVRWGNKEEDEKESYKRELEDAQIWGDRWKKLAKRQRPELATEKGERDALAREAAAWRFASEHEAQLFRYDDVVAVNCVMWPGGFEIEEGGQDHLEAIEKVMRVMAAKKAVETK
jgi:hypothetical protein